VRIHQFRFGGQHNDSTQPFATTDNLCFVIDVDTTADWNGTDCPAMLNIRARSTIGATLASVFKLTTDGKLTVGGADIVTGNSVRAYRSTTQSISNDTPTAISFDSERWDTNALHDNSTNPTRLKAPVAGTYSIAAHVQFADNATGVRQLAVFVNGSVMWATTEAAAKSTNNWLSLSTIIQLAANDYIEVYVYQNSGGSLNILSAANYTPECSMVRVSA
jgi:hypothetical protein